MRHLIFLHGALGHSNQLLPYEAYLSQHFTIHKILLDGHGGTALPEKGLSMEHYVEQLTTYMDQQHLEQADVFGYSMGGYVALCYALQHAERISSILTLGTKLNWTEEGAMRECKMLHPPTLSQKVPAYAAQLAQLHGAATWEQLVYAMADLITTLGKQPLLNEQTLSAIQVSTQLMVGDRDAMTSIAETRDAVQCLPNARLAVLPQTKHPLEQVRPNLLWCMMRDFWMIDAAADQLP